MSHEPQTRRSRKSGIYREGILVAVGLAVLTVLEYYVAITINWASLLLILAVLKGAMVVYYFMHISSLWSTEEEH